MSPCRVVAIIAAYNEADIIAQVVENTIAEGVDVYVIDNSSTDGTAAAVRPYLGRGLIGLETFPSHGADSSRFSWELLLRRKEELSRSLAGDWFIHQDADEFRESPWKGINLRDAIAQVDAAGFNAIDFQVLEFRLTAETTAANGNVCEALRFYQPGRPFDRVQIKCWEAYRCADRSRVVGWSRDPVRRPTGLSDSLPAPALSDSKSGARRAKSVQRAPAPLSAGRARPGLARPVRRDLRGPEFSGRPILSGSLRSGSRPNGVAD